MGIEWVPNIILHEILIFNFSFNGSKAILSGPAGGVVGYAMTAYSKKTGQPIIGFDMGGVFLNSITRLDLSIYCPQDCYEWGW